MSRELLTAYFDEIEQMLLNLPDLYVEHFTATLLTIVRFCEKKSVSFGKVDRQTLNK